MTEFLNQWVLPIALVIPVSIGLFLLGRRIDPERGPEPARTDPIPLDDVPAPDVDIPSSRPRARQFEPTLH